MGRIMDSIHYDKIADKLIQFHSKLPKEEDLCESHAIYTLKFVKTRIAQLLVDIDIMAKMDDSGWIR